ncbi:aminotransferase class III-fold pyridoxal phosphate-dependent enzyme, partial [Pandoraea terrae]|uniref:aminotransferase class III-fold pyridoxal phosphate-dependent enzyme n=1 Tax=Pandoraea terrae TaxID=1537710 RepID=UPI00123FCDF0
VFEEIRGLGLLLGAVLKPAYAGKAKDIVRAAEQSGLMLLIAGPDVIRFAPALNISAEEAEEGLRRLDAAVGAFVAAHPPAFMERTA